MDGIGIADVIDVPEPPEDEEYAVEVGTAPVPVPSGKVAFP